MRLFLPSLFKDRQYLLKVQATPLRGAVIVFVIHLHRNPESPASSYDKAPEDKVVGLRRITFREAKSEARAGLEPTNDGFANRCLSQLGDRASKTRKVPPQKRGHKKERYSYTGSAPLVQIERRRSREKG